MKGSSLTLPSRRRIMTISKLCVAAWDQSYPDAPIHYRIPLYQFIPYERLKEIGIANR